MEEEKSLWSKIQPNNLPLSPLDKLSRSLELETIKISIRICSSPSIFHEDICMRGRQNVGKQRKGLLAVSDTASVHDSSQGGTGLSSFYLAIASCHGSPFRSMSSYKDGSSRFAT